MDAGAALGAFVEHVRASAPDLLAEELPGLLVDWAAEQGISLPSPGDSSSWFKRDPHFPVHPGSFTTPADVLLPGVPVFTDDAANQLVAEPRLETSRLTGLIHPDGTATLAERGGRGVVLVPRDDVSRVARWLLGGTASPGEALALAQHLADAHGPRAVLRSVAGGARTADPALEELRDDLRRELDNLVEDGVLEVEEDRGRGRTGYRPKGGTE